MKKNIYHLEFIQMNYFKQITSLIKGIKTKLGIPRQHCSDETSAAMA